LEGTARATLNGQVVVAHADARTQVLTLTIADQRAPAELLILHGP